jgi:hypothetical protein
VVISATGDDPRTQDQPTELDAQQAEAAVEERTPDPKEAKRAEAQRKLALMQRLDPDTKLRVAKGEVTLEQALRDAGVDPGELLS